MILKLFVIVFIVYLNISTSFTLDEDTDENLERQLLKLNDSNEIFAKNRTVLIHFVRSQLKKELRKLKSSITDSIMEELVNYYGKKLEMTDTLKVELDQLTKKMNTMSQSLNILGQNYKTLGKNHRNLVDIVRNNMIAKKEQHQEIKSNNLKKKSIEAKPNITSKDKLKIEFINDLESKYSVLFEGAILNVLRSLNEMPKLDTNVSDTTMATKIFTSTASTTSNSLIIENIPTDCQDLRNDSFFQNGVYKITIVEKNLTFNVHCEFEDKIGWTVIQDRHDGNVNFFQNWNAYKEGFGNLDKNGDFWLGLENMHQLTNQYNYSLQVIMTDWKDDVYVAEYAKFRIDDEKNKYKLELGSYLKNVSTVGDSLGDSLNIGQGHNNMPFSTFDSDNDMRFYDNCAQIFRSGWWFNACFQSNLNGIYYTYGENSLKSDASKQTRSNKLIKKDEHSQLRFLRNGIHWNSIDLNLSLKSTKLRLKRH